LHPATDSLLDPAVTYKTAARGWFGMNSINPTVIGAAALAARLKRGDIALIDVREPEEHEDERIAGSTLVPPASFDPRKVTADHAGRTLVLYCMTGTRSARAAALFPVAGLPIPLTLHEGLFGWKAAGLPTEGSGAD
jgi:rhodanese-related sulfurtransferase